MCVDGVNRVERLKADRQSPVFARVQENERFIEIVPGVEEVEDSNRDKRRPRLRQNYVKQNLQWIRAVNLCRVIQFEWNGHKKLSEQEHIICVGEELRNDERQ